MTLERATRRRAAASPLGRVTLVVRLSARPVARLGVRALPARGHRVSRRRDRRAAAAARLTAGADALAQGASDDADLAGLREYQRGDPPQRVAWKAVARGAGWYTQGVRRRRRRRPGRARLGRAAARAADRGAAVAPDRVGARRERAARPFALALPRRAPAAAQGRDHRRAALTALALRRDLAVSARERAPRSRSAARDARARRRRADPAADPLARRAADRRAAPAGAAPADLGRRVRARARRRAPRAAARAIRCGPRRRRRASRRGRSSLFAVAAAMLIRASYGYLLGRDPSVAFLFVLVGIKFLETRTARDGTLLVVPRVLPARSRRSSSASRCSRRSPRCRRCSRVGGALDVLARTDARSRSRRASPARRRSRRTARMIVQGLPIAALLFVLFPRLAAPLWGMPPTGRATTGLSDSMSPGRSASCRCPTRSRSASSSTAAPPPSPQRYWRGPVLSRFDGRDLVAELPRLGADADARRRRARVSATRSRSSPRNRRGCSRSTCRRACRARRRRHAGAATTTRS